MSCAVKRRQLIRNAYYEVYTNRRIFVPTDSNGGWSIAAYECWMPGSYESPKAALLAFHFCDDILTKLQDRARERSPETCIITLADLRAEPQKRCDGCRRASERRRTEERT